jgi:hypothetical protein
MKAKFKFNVGQTVQAVDGFTAPIAICGITKSGVQYLLRNNFHEQWVDEDQLQLVNGEKPEPDSE